MQRVLGWILKAFEISFEKHISNVYSYKNVFVKFKKFF